MLKDKLRLDSVTALKSHDNKKVDVLRFLISLIDKKELQLPPGEIKEADEVAVLRKELKNKEESREMFLKANRDDLVKELDYEITVVKEYLPQSMSEEQISELVSESIKNNGTNFGMVMKEVMAKTGGQVDGSIVSKIVKEKISG